ncbi:MAG: DUF4238 domain-containing protein [Nitrospira sp.]|nr:DUF4238 domain-containing protein [Nitrospira sp.]
MPINSHYLPQFLLKGFSFRQRGDESYVHVYRKGCLPFSSNTKRVGAEGDFYGNGDIERTLSAVETQFAALARHLREGHCESSTKPLIDRFVAHSLVRTQAFRAGVHDIGSTVLREGFQEFLNPEHTPQLLAKLVEDVMLEPDVRNLLATVPADARPLIEETMRKMLLHSDMHEKLRQMILPTLDTIDIVVSVQSAQREVLENEKNLEKRIRDLKEIVWTIEIYDAHSLILGDIGPLVLGNESGKWGQIFHGIPQVIWFPLSDRSLLIGEISTSATRPDSEEVNTASAENSIKFFVASRRTQREDEYHRRIGSKVDRITLEQLSELKRTVRQYLTTPGGTLMAE